jgi:DNA ligase-1
MTKFKPMLAGNLREEYFDKLQFPLIVSPKIDGIRCLVHPELGAVTRTLKPIPNDYIREVLSRPEFHGFDGEIVNTEDQFNFQKTVSAVMTKSGEPEVTFVVFDLAYEDSVGFCYEDRLASLGDDFDIFKVDNKTPKNIQLELIETREVRTVEYLLAYEQRYLGLGYEGIMLRHPDRDYKFGRSSVNPNQQHLMKLKRFEDAEAVVSDFEEMMHNDNEAVINALGHTERSTHKDNKRGSGRLGKLVVVGTNGKWAGVEFRVSGFTHALSQEIWDNKQDYLGKTITYKYLDAGSKDKPRHPIFKSFREGF